MPSSFTIFAFMFTISLQILTFQYSGQHTVSILVYRMVTMKVANEPFDAFKDLWMLFGVLRFKSEGYLLFLNIS